MDNLANFKPVKFILFMMGEAGILAVGIIVIMHSGCIGQVAMAWIVGILIVSFFLNGVYAQTD